MAEEIWAREVREGWIDDIELAKKPGMDFGIEINCSAEMEDYWFGNEFGADSGREKHGEKLDRNRWRKGRIARGNGNKDSKGVGC